MLWSLWWGWTTVLVCLSIVTILKHITAMTLTLRIQGRLVIMRFNMVSATSLVTLAFRTAVSRSTWSNHSLHLILRVPCPSIAKSVSPVLSDFNDCRWHTDQLPDYHIETHYERACTFLWPSFRMPHQRPVAASMFLYGVHIVTGQGYCLNFTRFLHDIDDD